MARLLPAATGKEMRALLPLLLLACEADLERACARLEATEATLDIGTGIDAWEPLEDGDDLRIVLGLQGGHHVNASLLASGIHGGDTSDFASESNPIVSLWLETALDMPESGYRELPRPMQQVDADHVATIGDVLVLPGEIDGRDTPDALDGVAATVHADVLDACGTRLTASEGVILRRSEP